MMSKTKAQVMKNESDFMELEEFNFEHKMDMELSRNSFPYFSKCSRNDVS